LRFWDHDKILSDVVWVIREVQPDVHYTFPAMKERGMAIMRLRLSGKYGFTCSSRFNRFPEQFQYGVKPWPAKRIFGTRLISAATTPQATTS